MPTAEQITSTLAQIARDFTGVSIALKLLFAALVVFCVARKAIYPRLITAFVGLSLMTAAVLAVISGAQPNWVTFALLMIPGLFWGREAFTVRPIRTPSAPYLAGAGIFALIALSYPHFVPRVTSGWLDLVAFAPFGIIPCPTLIFAQAAIIALRRSLCSRTAAASWLVGTFYGVVGVFRLGVTIDWVLIAAIAAAIAAYFSAASHTKPSVAPGEGS